MEPISGLLGGGSMLAGAMKAAPLVMTAGSLLTKDKTLKDLLGIGALVTGGAGMLGGLGGAGGAGAGQAGIIEAANKSAMTGANMATKAAQGASGMRLKDLADLASVTGAFTGGGEKPTMGSAFMPVPQMVAPQAQQAPQLPKPQAFQYTPSAVEILRSRYG